MPNSLEVKVLTEKSSKTGKPYTAFNIVIDGVLIARDFIRPTELDYFAKIEGKYKISREEIK